MHEDSLDQTWKTIALGGNVLGIRQEGVGSSGTFRVLGRGKIWLLSGVCM